MRIDVLTREYPPDVYGGAGVHVAELVRALRSRDDLTTRVHAFGAPRDEAGFPLRPIPASEARHEGLWMRSRLRIERELPHRRGAPEARRALPELLQELLVGVALRPCHSGRRKDRAG